MKTALITGASSGIGKELARIHASKGGDLILVARRTEALEALKTELESTYKVQVSTFTQDLTQVHAAKKVYDFVNHSGLEVDYLMNNAGFGGHGVDTFKLRNNSWQHATNQCRKDTRAHKNRKI